MCQTFYLQEGSSRISRPMTQGTDAVSSILDNYTKKHDYLEVLQTTLTLHPWGEINVWL